MPHILTNTQYCWQHCITHPRYQPVFPKFSFFKAKSGFVLNSNNG
jgi:hypothetical protein